MDNCLYTCANSWPNRVSCDYSTVTFVIKPPALALIPSGFVFLAFEGPTKRAPVSSYDERVLITSGKNIK